MLFKKIITNLLCLFFTIFFNIFSCYSYSATTETYDITGTCTVLTTQPANVCINTVTSPCYNTDQFIDADKNILAGHTFTAVKSLADLPSKDGGVWFCDSSINNTPVFFVQRCTLIGFSRRDGNKTVEFTIPVGATNARVVAVAITQQGLVASALTSFKLCAKKHIDVGDITP